MQQQQQVITVPSGVEHEISLQVVHTGHRPYNRGDYRATVQDVILDAWRGDVTDGNYLVLPEGEYLVEWPIRNGFTVSIIQKPIALASGGGSGGGSTWSGGDIIECVTVDNGQKEPAMAQIVNECTGLLRLGVLELIAERQNTALNTVALESRCFNEGRNLFRAIPIVHFNQQTGEYHSTLYVDEAGQPLTLSGNPVVASDLDCQSVTVPNT